MCGREMTPRQLCGLPRGMDPCRFNEKGKNDGECYREDKGSRNGETEADRTLILGRSRRHSGRQTFVSGANDRLLRAQADAAPVHANFMDMPDREPELQRQSQKCEPCAETPWYRSNAHDTLWSDQIGDILCFNHYRGAQRVAPPKSHRGYDSRTHLC